MIEKRQLQIVIYNKHFQDILNKSLINYKIFSGKYFVLETSGIGKIYNAYNDSLLFKGEYSNGKKNGKGKEYDYFENLIFEGYYSNGKRHGKGKEYYDNGCNLLFDGEYFNGERNGKGKEYNPEGKLQFEGEYLNGKKWNGKGKEYNLEGKLKYEKEYLNGKLWNMKQYDNNNNIINELKEGKGLINVYSSKGKIITQSEYL